MALLAAEMSHSPQKEALTYESGKGALIMTKGHSLREKSNLTYFTMDIHSG